MYSRNCSFSDVCQNRMSAEHSQADIVGCLKVGVVHGDHLLLKNSHNPPPFSNEYYESVRMQSDIKERTKHEIKSVRNILISSSMTNAIVVCHFFAGNMESNVNKIRRNLVPPIPKSHMDV